jgi:hypothetical protein
MTFTTKELGVLVEALSMAGTRHRSESNWAIKKYPAAPRGKNHAEKADAMAALKEKISAALIRDVHAAALATNSTATATATAVTATV